jgi:hypothetical protein
MIIGARNADAAGDDNMVGAQRNDTIDDAAGTDDVIDIRGVGRTGISPTCRPPLVWSSATR